MLESHPGPDGSRLRALETIRAFRQGPADDVATLDAAVQRHADHYLALAEQAGSRHVDRRRAAVVATVRERLRQPADRRRCPLSRRASGTPLSASPARCATSPTTADATRCSRGPRMPLARPRRRRRPPLLAETFGNAGFGRWLRNDLDGARELADEGLDAEREFDLAPEPSGADDAHGYGAVHGRHRGGGPLVRRDAACQRRQPA